MPSTSTRKSSNSTSTKKTALTLLKADHAEVKELFKEFKKLTKAEDSEGQEEIVRAACKALTIHAQIEEEIFYPALRNAGVSEDSLDEADVEHSHIKELVGQLENASSEDELFEARVTVLSEYVEHHVQEEESTLFSEARKSDVDLVALGEELEVKKAELGGGMEPDVAQLAAAGRPDGGKRAHRSK